ncbi:MAG: FAD binding domain-containing protein [Pseudomonadota bacterium]
MKRFAYYQPENLREAFGLMEKLKGRARYIAGGTDVIVRMKQKALQPEALISLRGVAELREASSKGSLTLGSMTLLRDIERSRFIAGAYPALAEAVGRLANPQVRNLATLGGNLCNAAPSADCAPPLMVLEASLNLEGPGGERAVPIEDFFHGPGKTCMDGSEILRAVRIPERADHAGMAFLKEGRTAQDIALASAAALLVMEGRVCRLCRLAAGAVAPVPLRLKKIEKEVQGREIDPELLERVAEMVSAEIRPISDVRSSEEYRRTVTGVLVKRAMIKALENAGRLSGDPAPLDLGTCEKTGRVLKSTGSKEAAGPDGKAFLRKTIHFALNGHEVSVEADSHWMLHQVLREAFHLTGTKEGCGQGECGACTVLLDGMNVDACLYPIYEVGWRSVTTIEGLIGEGNRLHPVQEAFIEKGGVQCGFCTPGMILSAKALLDENSGPSDTDIREAISGNLCRCTGYIQIIDSIKRAAERMVSERPEPKQMKTGEPREG